MKKLIISLKSPHHALEDFANALGKARKSKGKVKSHYEISFDNKKDFERFVKNIAVLMCIQTFNPKSIYELSKLMNIDQSNMNKLIAFFENIGAIRIEEKKVMGRSVKIPIIDYEKIEFDLKAA